jgi:aminoglycoside 3-N-acetyltransferase
LIIKNDIVETLFKVGVSKGDAVCVHSFLGAFGKIEQDSVETVIKSLKESVGEYGTVLVPTFNYDFCQSAFYDPSLAQCQVGKLGEIFRNSLGVSRSYHPVYSHAVFGFDKSYFIKDLSTSGFGFGSIFEKMHKKNIRLIGFGVSMNYFTFLHYIEEKMQVPYRFYKEFLGTIRDSSGERNYKTQIYSRYLNTKPQIEFNLTQFENEMISQNILKKETLGRGLIYSILTKDLYEFTVDKVKQNPFALLKTRVEIINETTEK